MDLNAARGAGPPDRCAGGDPCDPWPAAVAAAHHFPDAATLPLPLPRRCVVVTAHAAEDLYAIGGLMSAMTHAGTELMVLVVSDGNGGSPGRLAGLPGPCARAASAALGIDARTRVRLALRPTDPDSARRDVAGAASMLVGRNPVRTLLIAPWHRDAHPEHATAGRAGVEVALGYRIPLLQYAVATWRHPGGPRTLPRDAVRRFSLPLDLRLRKDAAVGRPAPGPGGVRTGCASAELVLAFDRSRVGVAPVCRPG